MTPGIVKEWMEESIRTSERYVEGVADFLEFVVKNGGGKTIFTCPCKVCQNGKLMKTLDTITYHLFRFGIDPSYTIWHFHGENSLLNVKQQPPTEFVGHSRMEDMADDAFGIRNVGADTLVDPSLASNEGGLSEVHIDPQTQGGKRYKSLRASARERTRCIGSIISQTQIKASAPARKKFAMARSETQELKCQFARLEGSVNRRFDTLQAMLSVRTSGTQPSHSVSIPRASNTVVDSASTMGCASGYAHGTPCKLLNVAGEIIATAVVCKDQTARAIHGNTVLPTDETVSVEDVFLPSEKLWKGNGPFAKTFEDILKGSYVVWPKMLIEYGN